MKKYIIVVVVNVNGSSFRRSVPVETNGDIVRAIFIATFNMEREVTTELGTEDFELTIPHAFICS